MIKINLKLKNKSGWWIFILLAIIPVSCDKKVEESSQAIALAGDRKIDWKMIHRSYHLDPKWGRGLTQRESYENQLNFIIDQKLYAQAAIAKGLDRQPLVQDYLQFLKEKEMIKALYSQEVESKIHITDQEYEDAYMKLKKRVKLAYFRTPELSSAEKYRQELSEKLVQNIPLINAATDERGETDLISYGDMTEEIDDVAFDMELNEISDPIRSGQHYLVIKLIDGEKEKFLSKMDLAEHKSKIKKIIFDRRAAKLSDRFIYDLMKDEDVFLDPHSFQAVVAQFNRFVKREANPGDLPIEINDAELGAVKANLTDIKDDVLVTYKNGKMTVGEFLEKLFNMPAGLRPSVNMAHNVKKAIGIIVRNEYLIKRAYAEGLDHSDLIRTETEWQADDYLSKKYLSAKRSWITLSDEEVNRFKESDSYRNILKQKGHIIAEDQAENILADLKFLDMKIHLADSLRQVYGVSVDSTRFESQIEEPNMIIKQDPIRFVYREQFN